MRFTHRPPGTYPVLRGDHLRNSHPGIARCKLAEVDIDKERSRTQDHATYETVMSVYLFVFVVRSETL